MDHLRALKNQTSLPVRAGLCQQGLDAVQPMIFKKKVKKVYDANDQIFGTMAVEEVALDKQRNGRPVIEVLVKNDNENSFD